MVKPPRGSDFPFSTDRNRHNFGGQVRGSHQTNFGRGPVCPCYQGEYVSALSRTTLVRAKNIVPSWAREPSCFEVRILIFCVINKLTRRTQAFISPKHPRLCARRSAYMDIVQEAFIEKVPQETLEAIIDELAEERVALKACCLVNRRWIWRGRYHLFKAIRFSSVSGLKSLQNWSAVMNPNGTNPPVGRIALAQVSRRYACHFH